MNIVKSLYSGILHRPFSLQGKNYFSVSLLWGFSLDSGEPVLEQKLWEVVGQRLEKGAILDACMPKPNGEFLVFGSFFSPGQQPVTSGMVAVRVGSIKKALAVFGQRHWSQGPVAVQRIIGPEPMSTMTISYTHAYGGDNDRRNPVGIGMKKEGELHLLPNIEYPNELIAFRSDRPRPAGFSSLDATWEPRASKGGTYDEHYLQTRMPGFPDDISLEHFNAAPPDQWLNGFFTGDEAIEIENMHPGLARQASRLPGVIGRCFVNQDLSGDICFKEVPCRLDTVLLFPADNLGVVLHRGSMECIEDDALDIRQILLAHENLRGPLRTPQYYRDQLQRRTDPETGFKYLLSSAPLIPEGCRCPFELFQPTVSPSGLMDRNLENYVQRQEAEARQLADEKIDELLRQQEEMVRQMEASGVDVGPFVEELEKVKAGLKQKQAMEPPKASPEEEALKDLIERILPNATDPKGTIDLAQLNLEELEQLGPRLEQVAASQKDELVQRVKAPLQALKDRGDLERIKNLGNEFEGKGIAEAFSQNKEFFDIDGILSQIESGPDSPTTLGVLPRFRFSRQFESLKEKIAETEEQLAHYQHQLASLEDNGTFDPNQTGVADALAAGEKLGAMRQEIEQMETELLGAEQQAREGYATTAHYLDASASPHPGEEAAIAEKLLADYQQGLPTAAGDYAFVDLSSRCLPGIDLSGSYLEYVDLSNTDLSGADLSHTILAHANLTNTNLSGANLSGANIGGAIVHGTRCADADLRGATLARAKISQAHFSSCLFGDREDLFLETEISQSEFIGCSMQGINFIGRNLTDCCFDDTDLTNASFIQTILQRASFRHACLNGVNFIEVQGAQALFPQAQMKNARFISGCSMTEADFTEAGLQEANLRETDLRKANFTGAQLEKADLSGSNCCLAIFARANAVQAQFIKTDLRFSRLERVNLMEGSLMKANLEGANFRQSNLFSVSFIGSMVRDTDFSGAYLEQTVVKG